jgi:hypothetical protein
MPKYNVVLKAIKDNSQEGAKAFLGKLATTRKQTVKQVVDSIKKSAVLWSCKERKNAEQAMKFIESIGGIAEIVEELVCTPSPLPIYRTDIKENTVSSINEESIKMECPKCGFTQKQTEVCIKCGIIFRKYKARKVVAQIQESVDDSELSSYEEQTISAQQSIQLKSTSKFHLPSEEPESTQQDKETSMGWAFGIGAMAGGVAGLVSSADGKLGIGGFILFMIFVNGIKPTSSKTVAWVTFAIAAAFSMVFLKKL